MKHVPISIQTFEKIREDDLIYVDKTHLIYQLVKNRAYYFISRPRRFGKSLLLTTIKSFFRGHEHLFKGLYIYDKIEKWEQYPVVHIDYSLVEYKQGQKIFEISLLNHLNNIAHEYNIDLSKTIIADAFSELINKLHNQYGKVVILVDEYDKPMVDTLTKPEKFEENREILRGLYGTMKGLDSQLRFVMLTGVSRFAKVNVFSGMNNLEDISMTESYSQITGFSQSELETYFAPHIEAVRQKFNTKKEILLEAIKKKYNGFSWDAKHFLYNPFSIFKFLLDKEFGNYWFSTGTPTFLIDLIIHQKSEPANFENIKVADLEGSSLQIKNLPLIPLLFQTGYLTIKKITYDGFAQRFFLDYPNDEVSHSFITFLAAAFVQKDEFEIQPEAIELRDALREERTNDFINRLQSFLADIPARLHLPKEAYYHSLVYMLLRLTGMKMLLEKETDKGRIDAVLELPDKIYIIEFKFAQVSKIKRAETLANQALKQIEEKKYYEPYLGSSKKIILFGMGFLEKIIEGKIKIIN